MPWKITFDPAKRDWTLRERGLDFADATEVFDGLKLEHADDRRDYGLSTPAHGHRRLDAAR
jgi:uncharacterized DUF497 family protein